MPNYHCDTCNKDFKSKSTYNRHQTSKRHLDKLTSEQECTQKSEFIEVPSLEEKKETTTIENIKPIQHIDLDTSTTQNIKYIFHLSDIHIPCDKRHSEYREVFSRFLQEMEEKSEILEESIVVITGDFLDNKNRITPEEIVLAREFVLDLAYRCPVFIIAGNHDKNLHFVQKEDNISAIVSNGHFPHSSVYYLKHTGSYRFRNVTFSVSSVFDYRMVKVEEVPENEYRVALFHGGVGKYILYNGSHCKESSVSVDHFRGYDVTLLGDIHKWQFLNREKTIAYAGSMLQKNHGENYSDHGYLLWDLPSRSATHHPLPNRYRFVTLSIVDGNLMTPLDNLPENLYVRWEIKESGSNVPPPNRIQESIRNRFNVLEEKYSHSAYFSETAYVAGPRTVFDLGVEKQRDYMNSWAEQEKKPLSDSDNKMLDSLNQKYNTIVQESIPPAIQWKLLTLTFENIFCYQEKQHIDFQNMRGVNGIVARNNAGKSAIFDILLFTLFGKCTRSDLYSYTDLVHVPVVGKESENTLKCTLTFHTVERGETYVIERTCTRERQSMMVGISKNRTQIYHGSARDANLMISKLIGNYEDFLTTTVLAQNSIHNFLIMVGRNQKEFTSRVFRLDLYEKLHKLAKKDLRVKDTDRSVAEKQYNELLQENPGKILEELSSQLESLCQEKKTVEETLNNKVEERNSLWQEKSSRALLKNDPHESLPTLQTQRDKLIDKQEILEKTLGSSFCNVFQVEENIKTSLDCEDIARCKQELKVVQDELKQCQMIPLDYVAKQLETLWAQIQKSRNNLRSLLNEKKNKIKSSLSLSFEKHQTRYNRLLDDQKKTDEFLTQIKNKISSQMNTSDESLYHLREAREQLLLQLPSKVTRNDPLPSLKIRYLSDALDLPAIMKKKQNYIELLQKQTDALQKQLHYGCKNVEVLIGRFSTKIESLQSRFHSFNTPLPPDFNEKTQEIKLRESKITFENNKKKVREIELMEEKLKVHRYDPKCKYCCENPFVQKARSSIAQLPEMREQLLLLQESIDVLENRLQLFGAEMEKENLLGELSKEIEVVSLEVKEISEGIVVHQEIEEEKLLRNEIQKRVDDLKKKITLAESEQKEKEKLVRSLEIGENLVTEWDQFVTEMKMLLDQFVDIEKENKVIKNRLPVLQKKEKDLNAVLMAYEEIEKVQLQIDTFSEKIRIKVHNQEVYDANTQVNELLQKLDKKIPDLRSRLTQLIQEEVSLTIKRDHQKDLLVKQQAAEKRFQDTHAECRILKLYCSMTHHNGVPAYLLRKISKLLEETTNGILSQYSQMQVKVKDEVKETVIKVKTPSKSSYLNAKMLCGSEKFLVEMAFRVAFQLLSNVSKPNFMVCDEGWSCLDENARSKLRNLLSALLEHNEYLLTVSHINDVKAWMTQAISIDLSDDGKHHIIQHSQA